jgi:hypothetical protein
VGEGVAYGRVEAGLIDLHVEDGAPPAGTPTVWTPRWNWVMSPFTHARSRNIRAASPTPSRCRATSASSTVPSEVSVAGDEHVLVGDPRRQLAWKRLEKTTGATGLEPATSGVTDRYRLHGYSRLRPRITGYSRRFVAERPGCDRLQPATTRQSLCSRRVVAVVSDEATDPRVTLWLLGSPQAAPAGTHGRGRAHRYPFWLSHRSEKYPQTGGR